MNQELNLQEKIKSEYLRNNQKNKNRFKNNIIDENITYRTGSNVLITFRYLLYVAYCLFCRYVSMATYR